MFIPPRFIALDDKQEHLNALKDAFQRENSDCLCICYDPARDLTAAPFKGVRVLLMDIHLTVGPTGSDDRHHFGVIAAILEQVISPTGGPFILVVWTQHPQLRAQLRTYLDTNIEAARAYARPIDIMALDKAEYIDLVTGNIRAGGPSLQQALQGAIAANPQISALFAWESEVVTAAGNTLASLFELIPPQQRTGTAYAEALDNIMSHLAIAALGKANALENPRTAINATLAPILADRVLNQTPLAGSEALWRAAVTQIATPPADPTPQQAAQLNSMLHIAQRESETISPTDWGAVIEFPFAWNDTETQRLFGTTVDKIQLDEFRIKPEKIAECSIRLVRIGGSCDYAQNKAGPITYLLGIEMPSDAVSNGKRRSGPASEWETPLILKGANNTTRYLAVNCRFILSIPQAQCSTWIARYRLREGLLTDLINHDANYMSRPGIIEFRKTSNPAV